jgi:hypothetical protein
MRVQMGPPGDNEKDESVKIGFRNRKSLMGFIMMRKDSGLMRGVFGVEGVLT